MNTIYLCMGCFNAPYMYFQKNGYNPVAGYMIDNYFDSQLSTDNFYEVVRLNFNDEEELISILKIFFENHEVEQTENNPVPKKYRSAIFLEKKEFIRKTKSIKKQYGRSRINAGKNSHISTKIAYANKFISAEINKTNLDEQLFSLKFNGVIL